MRFRLDAVGPPWRDGAIVDTTACKRHWYEQRFWNGFGMCSRSTGLADVRETLFQTYDDQYFLLTEGPEMRPCCEWLTDNQAERWLLANGFKFAVQVRR